MSETYSIPECNIESLEKKLTRIRNKCEKYGLAFKYERTGEHFETVTLDVPTGQYDYTGEPITKRKTQVVKFIDIEVEGKAEVSGWRFAASLEYTKNGNFIHGVDGIEVPERFYNCEPWCEHCKTRRDRRNSYIVQNTETGEFKQVGKSCLKDFTHGLSAEAVAHFESFFKELEEARDGGSWSGSPLYYNVHDFLVAAAECIRLFGYIRSTDNGISTAYMSEMLFRVENNMRLPFNMAEDIRKWYDDAVERGWDTKRQESIDLAENARKWILANEKNDNYFHNLKVACSQTYTAGDLGLLVSIFPTYNRELEWEAERRERERKDAEARAHSTYMGEVGSRVQFVIDSIHLITSWETQWGRTYVYKLSDANGQQATWKTSAWLDDDDIGKTCKGTVKEHKEFRGIKQTELTRCRIA